MKLVRHLVWVVPSNRARVIAIGRFDGVHLGHQRVLARLRQRAADMCGEALVLLRHHAPSDAVLTGLREQLELLAAGGIACVVLDRGSQLSRVELATALGAVELVSGAGNSPAPSNGLAVDRVPTVVIDGVAIDGNGIRAALARGDLAAAARWLGRDYTVSGRVIHGHHRGGPLGIPTANIRVRGLQLPPDGVYAVHGQIGAHTLRGVANVGFNPTFGNRARSVETHLLDFHGDVYGRRLAISFVARLRGEQRFAGVDALLAQIRADIAAARRVFGEHGC
jgi:riboflavin kinase/FMN adenylyltransferase